MQLSFNRSAFLVALVICVASFAQTTRPATQPAAKVSDTAKPVLDSLRDGYAKTKTLDLAGSVTLHLDAAGKKQSEKTSFTASYQSPGKFKHEMKDDLLVVADGQHLYIYLPEPKRYFALDALKDRGELGDLPAPLTSKMEQQNPSLLLMLVKDAAQSLTGGADSVERDPDVTLDGTSYQSLRFVSQLQEIHALVDPKTGLLRQLSVDLKHYLTAQGVPQVNAATVMVDYTRTVADAPVKTAFSWVPPADALEVKLPPPDAPAGPAQTEEAITAQIMAMAGKQAPTFTLNDLQDKAVSLGDLKGKVIVLDFWATWCVPCLVSLPRIDALHKEMASKGVQVFAVNVQEQKAQVQKFVETNSLSMPVLLDPDGKASAQYMAVERKPITYVIGKDGAVFKAFPGYGPDTEKLLHEAVEEALK
ncbi:MAG TPA: redoxin domain-containing protein [Tepidisphaeraceae bacterium]|nr:redoxin domain-containing protein [Tepidisphaeraceae bacterium]